MKLSKNQLKLITSLSQKKYRQKHQLFVAEGIKVVDELLHSSFVLDALFTTDVSLFDIDKNKQFLISDADLKKISNLKSPNKVLALFKIHQKSALKINAFSLVLDAVNDPGNLGTIIRLCDWFGVEQIVCSKDTVDCFNPKVVQATMGSLSRVSIHYTEIENFIRQSSLECFIADMNGKNVYSTKLPKDAILIMGNEANGVSDKVKKLVSTKISIPRFGDLKQTESLNVATATAILVSEFKRFN